MKEINGEKRKSDFRVKIGEIFKDDKRDISIIDREIRTRYKKNGSISNDKWYKYICNKDGYEDWIIESDLLTRKRGCKFCSGHAIILGINTIWDTDPWMIPIVGEDVAKKYTHGSDFKIYPICPDCGCKKSIKMALSTIFRYKSMNCNCSDSISYPNKFAFKLLEQLKVNFINEYSPDWIKPKAYDFYFKVNNKEYILEMDGGLGHGNNKHSKSKISIEESKAIDDYKDEQAKLHGIEVIRIDCYCDYDKRFEYIKQNIKNNERLNNLFNLAKVDFIKCHEYSLSNLVKIASEYKRKNPELTTVEIGKIMGYRSDTVLDWLKDGTLVNWCNYDSKEEMIKNAKRNRPKNKQIEVFKNGVSQGIYPSGTYLQEHGEELFGVKLLISKISSVCHGKRKHHQGLVFKIIN
jgi:hypothetical protein